MKAKNFLTKDFLRAAADRIGPWRYGDGNEGYNDTNMCRFMCWAIDAESRFRHLRVRAVRREFCKLLNEHGICTFGNLGYRPIDSNYFMANDSSDVQKQEQRFMFLNFLAESTR